MGLKLGLRLRPRLRLRLGVLHPHGLTGGALQDALVFYNTLNVTHIISLYQKIVVYLYILLAYVLALIPHMEGQNISIFVDRVVHRSLVPPSPVDV